ncbi:MAG TPA: hypothetical protein VF795_01930 [Desulfuromonadaceae bacterium]
MKRFVGISLAVMVLLLGSVAASEAHFRGDIWIGPGWGPGWWGPGWWGPPYPYPYYTQPPVIVQQPPDIYMEQPQSEEPSYWYYCPNPKGYYPYVKQCPNGWMKVVPSPPPPQRKE